MGKKNNGDAFYIGAMVSVKNSDQLYQVLISIGPELIVRHYYILRDMLNDNLIAAAECDMEYFGGLTLTYADGNWLKDKITGEEYEVALPAGCQHHTILKGLKGAKDRIVNAMKMNEGFICINDEKPEQQQNKEVPVTKSSTENALDKFKKAYELGMFAAKWDMTREQADSLFAINFK